MLDLNKVYMVKVRLEGCVNQNWTLTASPNEQVSEYYAIEGSPRVEGTDERVGDTDPKLAEFLELMIQAEPPGLRDQDNDVVEYTAYRYPEPGEGEPEWSIQDIVVARAPDYKEEKLTALQYDF